MAPLNRNESYTFRETVPGDLAALLALSNQAYGEYAAVLTPDNWQRMHQDLNDVERLAQLIRKSRGIACLDGGRLVGMAFLVPHGHPTHINPGHWAYISLVGVHPAYRGQGIAERLTTGCIGQARALGESVVALHSSEIMGTARKLYERLGFTQVRELDTIYGKRSWLYKLELR
jgi:ribosomal protein S18 acetylase RimI-like enzyme